LLKFRADTGDVFQKGDVPLRELGRNPVVGVASLTTASSAKSHKKPPAPVGISHIRFQ